MKTATAQDEAAAVLKTRPLVIGELAGGGEPALAGLQLGRRALTSKRVSGDGFLHHQAVVALFAMRKVGNAGELLRSSAEFSRVLISL